MRFFSFRLIVINLAVLMMLAPASGRAALNVEFENFNDGLGAVRVNGKWGFINKAGDLVIEPLYNSFHEPREGLIGVFINKKCGFINQAGKWVIKPKYEYGCRFVDGLANVEINGKWGFINKSDEWVIKPIFTNSGGFHEGLASAEINGKVGFINKSGKWIIEPKFEENFAYFSEGVANVKLGGKVGFINKTGEWVIEPKFDIANDFKEGFAKVQVNQANNEWRIINKSGEFVTRSEQDYFFSEGLRSDEVNGKWGFVNQTGEWVIEPQFNKVEDFSDGLCLVEISGKQAYIDKTGNVVISPAKLSKSMERLSALAEVKEKQQLVAFRKSLKQGDDTNCGSAIEIKGKLVKVSFAVRNYGNEHWIKRDQVFPPGAGCEFVNGEYRSPQ